MQSLEEMDKQLQEVAEALTASILSTDAHVEYGTEGRETMGGTMMASLARALVSLQGERRHIRKQLSDTIAEDSSKDKVVQIQAAPSIPRPEGA